MAAFRLMLLLLWAGLYGPLATHAQPLGQTFRFIKTQKHKVRLGCQIQRNLIVVSAFINEAGPYNFLLDTGVGTSLLTDPAVANSLHLQRGQPFRVVGAGGEATGLLAYQTDSVRVRLPGVVAPNMRLLVLSEDALNLSGYVGMPIHGILGAELFQSFVVAVRPEQRTLRCYAPASYRPPRGARWASLPLSLEENKAYLTTPVQLSDSLTLPLKLVLDTGAGHALSLETTADPRLALPTPHLAASLGQGLSGVVRGHLGRVATLQLGRYVLRSVLTSFPDSADVHQRATVARHGNIGLELLKRFSLIIDYPHQRLLLRPNVHFATPFEHDMSGLELLAVGPNLRNFLVLRVAPGSPAAAAGIAADDQLISVNFAPAGFFTLTQLSQLLHSTDGRVLHLLLLRPSGELHAASLRLKRQI